MRILVVGQVFYPDHFRINDVVKELAKDHQVKMVTGLPDYDLGKVPKEFRLFRRRRENFHGAEVIRVPIISRRKGPVFRSLNYISYALMGSIYTFFLREKYDVVFSFQTSPITMFLPGLVYAKKNKVRSVLYTLDLWPESVKAMSIREGTFFFDLVHRMSRRIYKGADKVLVSSPSFMEYLKEKIGLSSERMDYLPQYTDEIAEGEEILYAEEKDEKSVDARLEKLRTFTFAGNIGFVQDLETIVEAASKIKGKPFQIHIVGSGSNEGAIRDLVRKKKIEDHFMFHGRKDQEEMDDIYKCTDVCLLTLRNDDFIGRTIPGKLQTYMAKGKAIAGAISYDSMDIIKESGAGYCVESGDALGLSQIMVKYINDADLVRSCGKRAFEYYENHFRKEIFIESLLKHLKGEEKNV